MDERTARDAARIRGWASLAAAVLGDLLAIGCAAFALSAPPEAEALLWAAFAVALAGVVGCVLVMVANRRLALDPRDPRPLAHLVLVPPGVLLAWLVAVLAVLGLTREVAWTLGALGLVTLALPALVLTLITRKGPHPA